MISLISHVECNAVQISQIITQEEFKQSVVFSHSPLNSHLKLKKMSKQTTDWSTHVTPPPYPPNVSDGCDFKHTLHVFTLLSPGENVRRGYVPWCTGHASLTPVHAQALSGIHL